MRVIAHTLSFFGTSEVANRVMSRLIKYGTWTAHVTSNVTPTS